MRDGSQICRRKLRRHCVEHWRHGRSACTGTPASWGVEQRHEQLVQDASGQLLLRLCVVLDWHEHLLSVADARSQAARLICGRVRKADLDTLRAMPKCGSEHPSRLQVSSNTNDKGLGHTPHAWKGAERTMPSASHRSAPASHACCRALAARSAQGQCCDDAGNRARCLETLCAPCPPIDLDRVISIAHRPQMLASKTASSGGLIVWSDCNLRRPDGRAMRSTSGGKHVRVGCSICMH